MAAYFQEEHHRYINKIKEIPYLTHHEEFELAQSWREGQDQKSHEILVSSHLRLVAKIASGYRGYGLPLSDLIAEGNIGMLQAMKHYDPQKGFRLSTYAMWWIKASIQEHILKSWSLVKMGTTAAQKKLFFSLKRTKENIQKANNEEELTPEIITKIAQKLNVSETEVIEMNQRLSAKDSSLNSPLSAGEENSSEWIEWIADERENPEIHLIQRDEMTKRRVLFEEALKALNKREHDILYYRRLHEPPYTLLEVSEKLDISRERVRQIENTAFEKLKKRIHNLIQNKRREHI